MKPGAVDPALWVLPFQARPALAAARPAEVEMRKKVAVAVAMLSAVYLFVPEPTDVVPILGWLDEGMALALLGWALRTLGVGPLRWGDRTRALTEMR